MFPGLQDMWICVGCDTVFVRDDAGRLREPTADERERKPIRMWRAILGGPEALERYLDER